MLPVSLCILGVIALVLHILFGYLIPSPPLNPPSRYFRPGVALVVLDSLLTQMSCFWNLLNAVYPVVGSGLFRAQIQSTAAIGSAAQRIEILIGALEVSECR
jgi:hypothetical protein